jgi:chromosome segregation ATPase
MPFFLFISGFRDIQTPAHSFLSAKRIGSILAAVGIDLGDSAPVHSTPLLRAAVSEYIDVSLLAQIAETASLVSSLSVSLGVSDSSLSSLISAVSDLLLEQRKTKEQRRLEQEKIDSVKSVLQEATETLHSADKSSKQLDEKFEAQRPVLAERQSQLKYLDGKSKEYALQMQNLKEQVRASGVTPAIYHSALKTLHAQVSAVEEQANEKQNHLNAYKSLPPVRP